MDVIDPYIERYGERLYGLCRALCASRADADDLYQETWLRAVRSFARYDPARPFAPWITRICVNVYRSQLRRRALSPVYNRFATTEEKDAALAAAPAPERAEYGELYDAVARLPERLRVAVILYYFRDMDVAAAARALRLPAGTVKSRLHKARALLREALADAPQAGEDAPGGAHDGSGGVKDEATV